MLSLYIYSMMKHVITLARNLYQFSWLMYLFNDTYRKQRYVCSVMCRTKWTNIMLG